MIACVYQANVIKDCSLEASKVTKHHQDKVYLLMMIQHIPRKQILVYHVAVWNTLYFKLHKCIASLHYAVMTRVVSMPFIMVNSFDPHGPLHVEFVVDIIPLPLSVLLLCM